MKKRILKTALTMALSTALVLSSVAMVFGAETKQVKYRLPQSGTTSEAAATTSEVAMEITNIISDEDSSFIQLEKKLYEKMGENHIPMPQHVYVGQAPVTITLAEDNDFAGWEKTSFPDKKTVYNLETYEKWSFDNAELEIGLQVEGELTNPYDFEGNKIDVKETVGFLYTWSKGATITLSEPGFYAIQVGDFYTGALAYIHILGSSASIETPAKSETITAKQNPSKVMVNGAETAFEAYNIDGNNYFKLRDLANVVSGTEKQFEVTYDNASKAINLVSNKAYTASGGELAKGDGKDKQASLSASPINKDGQPITLTAYTINGNNYFKLRDIAKAFDIGVTYDNATKTIGIDTSIGYVE